MPNSGQTDAEILQRATRDAQGSFLRMVQDRLEDVKPSFDAAYDRMSNKGKPLMFLMKTGSIGLGAVLMADGIYHLIAGSDERVEDLFLQHEKNPNYTRMFTGAGQLSLGAILAFAGATKGPLR